MKTNNIIRSLLFALPFAVLLSACSEEFIALETGKLPDEASFATLKSSMRSAHSFSGVTIIDIFAQEEGEEPEITAIDELVLTLNKPAPTDLTAEIVIGSEFSAEYNAEVERRDGLAQAYWAKFQGQIDKLEYKKSFFPTANLQISAETVTIKAGETNSEKISVKVNGLNLDLTTIYFLPVEIKLKDMEQETVIGVQYVIVPNPRNTILDGMGVPTNIEIEAEIETDLFSVFYINTEEYQPLLINGMLIDRYQRKVAHKYYYPGSIINLRPAVVDYFQGRCILSLNSDLRYVLNHSIKYIRPVQNLGRKVCICIQGGGKGIGFCNMSDAQIEDFTAQVKNVVETYGLDGVNLWDEGSAYGKEGFPPMNTTSYPKLIKSLREALPGKLVTIVDKDEPTEYFHDAALCGGIEVGKYIDYAWHGYFSEYYSVQIIEPWENSQEFSEFERKAISGMEQEKYGCVNIPRWKTNPGGENDPMEYMNNIDDSNIKLARWKATGRKKSNIIVFGSDLKANEQGVYEGELGARLGIYSFFHEEGRLASQNPDGSWSTVRGKYSFSFLNASKVGDTTYKMYQKDW